MEKGRMDCAPGKSSSLNSHSNHFVSSEQVQLTLPINLLLDIQVWCQKELQCTRKFLEIAQVH